MGFFGWLGAFFMWHLVLSSYMDNKAQQSNMQKTLTLTIVIPVYNEEHHIKACLDAVQHQTDAPDQVIVVDNNCTDNTIAIANSYPFVTIIKEPRQGRGWARTAGFSIVQTDIIGRIDADSQIEPGWVAHAKQRFSDDTELMGLTGIGSAALLPRVHFWYGTFWSRAYYWLVHSQFATHTMWGACMAIRAIAWQSIEAEVCNDDAIVHEDQDMSLCMAAKGLKIVQDNDLKIRTDAQSYHYLPKLIYYAKLEQSTIHHHKAKGTFLSHKYLRIPAVVTIWGRMFAMIMTVPFLLISILFWPIDRLMIALGKGRWWLG